MTTPPMLDGLPHLSAVCLLDAYSKAHDKGNSEIKSALWNLNKARRQKGSIISAEDVREELRAQTVLRESSTPDLVVEGISASNKQHDDDDEDRFQLVNAMEEIKAMRTTPTATSKSKDEGLRHRRTADTAKKTEWTEETEEEVDRLRSADPIELFGALTPRDLLAAQADAKKALASYVEAANLAAAILDLTTSNKK